MLLLSVPLEHDIEYFLTSGPMMIESVNSTFFPLRSTLKASQAKTNKWVDYDFQIVNKASQSQGCAAGAVIKWIFSPKRREGRRVYVFRKKNRLLSWKLMIYLYFHITIYIKRNRILKYIKLIFQLYLFFLKKETIKFAIVGRHRFDMSVVMSHCFITNLTKFNFISCQPSLSFLAWM